MDVDISNLVTRLPGLRMIGIGGLSFLTDASLHSIAAGCPFLESLYACDLPNVTHAGLEALLRGCTRLHRVAMSNCGRLPPADVAMLRSKYSYVFKGDMLPDNVARAENEFLAAVG
ncbi:hypothetical protein Vretimale_18017 [Volvox reticuliferus]|uniref:Uncharacterized protein n=1 Tax=Volvox reticuliferus TaxID=1737510 RepID=A0A8J4CWB7_9CHLO|nr:hypothetical protein Vretifemale_17736 [Volvox reticuliferus]GIM15215.1 hypothetical protein Vretimale_18017 [Volvox reticuliferus]